MNNEKKAKRVPSLLLCMILLGAIIWGIVFLPIMDLGLDVYRLPLTAACFAAALGAAALLLSRVHGVVLIIIGLAFAAGYVYFCNFAGGWEYALNVAALCAIGFLAFFGGWLLIRRASALPFHIIFIVIFVLILLSSRVPASPSIVCYVAAILAFRCTGWRYVPAFSQRRGEYRALLAHATAGDGEEFSDSRAISSGTETKEGDRRAADASEHAPDAISGEGYADAVPATDVAISANALNDAQERGRRVFYRPKFKPAPRWPGSAAGLESGKRALTMAVIIIWICLLVLPGAIAAVCQIQNSATESLNMYVGEAFGAAGLDPSGIYDMVSEDLVPDVLKDYTQSPWWDGGAMDTAAWPFQNFGLSAESGSILFSAYNMPSEFLEWLKNYCLFNRYRLMIAAAVLVAYIILMRVFAMRRDKMTQSRCRRIRNKNRRRAMMALCAEITRLMEILGCRVSPIDPEFMDRAISYLPRVSSLDLERMSKNMTQVRFGQGEFSEEEYRHAFRLYKKMLEGGDEPLTSREIKKYGLPV